MPPEPLEVCSSERRQPPAEAKFSSGGETPSLSANSAFAAAVNRASAAISAASSRGSSASRSLRRAGGGDGGGGEGGAGGGDGGDGGGAGLGGGDPNCEYAVELKKISAVPSPVRYSHAWPSPSSPAPSALIVALRASACCFNRISSSATDSRTCCCTVMVASKTWSVSSAWLCNSFRDASPISNRVFQ